MVLVDSSVWIDHLRKPVLKFYELLERHDVLAHPLLIGEIAMGSLKNRAPFLQSLSELPMAILAREEEVLRMVESEALHGLGIGYIDAHLLAATRLTPDAELWTRDKRLDSIAEALGLRYAPIP
jgi:predicted nucleic acid-binding protein